MKIKNIVYSSIGILLLFSSCSKQDNYEAPNAAIHGSIIDNGMKTSVQTEQPNGIKIRLLEEKYGERLSPIDFWAKQDGTFENSTIFPGKYKVVPIEGPFFPADTLEVNINGTTEVNLTVTPFLTISASVLALANSAVVKYQVARPRVGDKIIEAKSLSSAYPSVSNVINELAVKHDLSGVSDESILSTEYTDTLTGLNAGQTYYIRVAARTNNANNKYNYSPVMEVKIP